MASWRTCTCRSAPYLVMHLHRPQWRPRPILLCNQNRSYVKQNRNLEHMAAAHVADTPISDRNERASHTIRLFKSFYFESPCYCIVSSIYSLLHFDTAANCFKARISAALTVICLLFACCIVCCLLFGVVLFCFVVMLFVACCCVLLFVVFVCVCVCLLSCSFLLVVVCCRWLLLLIACCWLPVTCCLLCCLWCLVNNLIVRHPKPFFNFCETLCNVEGMVKHIHIGNHVWHGQLTHVYMSFCTLLGEALTQAPMTAAAHPPL